MVNGEREVLSMMRSVIMLSSFGATAFIQRQAAWYPNQPSSQDEQFMSDFMKALARFYPCTWCASDFQRNIELSPPK